MACFRQLLDAPGGAFSYLLGCGESRTALMLDPALEQATLVLGMLEELGLDLLWVVETHLHADHVTAADALRAATGARVAVGRLTGIDGADRLLDDGDVIACGGVRRIGNSTRHAGVSSPLAVPVNRRFRTGKHRNPPENLPYRASITALTSIRLT